MARISQHLWPQSNSSRFQEASFQYISSNAMSLTLSIYSMPKKNFVPTNRSISSSPSPPRFRSTRYPSNSSQYTPCIRPSRQPKHSRSRPRNWTQSDRVGSSLACCPLVGGTLFGNLWVLWEAVRCCLCLGWERCRVGELRNQLWCQCWSRSEWRPEVLWWRMSMRKLYRRGRG